MRCISKDPFTDLEKSVCITRSVPCSFYPSCPPYFTSIRVATCPFSFYHPLHLPGVARKKNGEFAGSRTPVTISRLSQPCCRSSLVASSILLLALNSKRYTMLLILRGVEPLLYAFSYSILRCWAQLLPHNLPINYTTPPRRRKHNQMQRCPPQQDFVLRATCHPYGHSIRLYPAEYCMCERG